MSQVGINKRGSKWRTDWRMQFGQGNKIPLVWVLPTKSQVGINKRGSKWRTDFHQSMRGRWRELNLFLEMKIRQIAVKHTNKGSVESRKMHTICDLVDIWFVMPSQPQRLYQGKPCCCFFTPTTPTTTTPKSPERSSKTCMQSQKTRPYPSYSPNFTLAANSISCSI